MEERTIGLRERKKSNRRQEILVAARELFAQAGYAATTVDAIAERVGISGVTVYNYFGTKSGVLLALVMESEERLLEEIGRRLDAAPDDTVEIVMDFSRTMRRNAGDHLDRALWRQVFAASLVDVDSSFGNAYRALNQRLAAVLGKRLERVRRAGALPADVDACMLGAAFFNVQIVTFARFVSDDSIEEATIETELRQLVLALTKARG